MDKKYYIGIDMGTDSVGWAVTDENYNLVKARGGDLWGSYLFDEAEAAEGRRVARSARRRTARVRQRILLLQELFAEEMAKIDSLFFIRLNNSKLRIGDKDERLNAADCLFADKLFTDKTYFAEFPTVYHLRAACLNGEINDIRLLYLAVHHIIKNRGHFLFEGQSFSVGDTSAIRNKFCYINAVLGDMELPTMDLFNLDAILSVLRQNNVGRRYKQKEISRLLNAGKDKCISAISKAITGCTVSLKELCCADAEFDGIKSFSFEKATFDEQDMPAIESAAGTEIAGFVRALKAVYDWSVLCGIMGEDKYISLSKVRIYEKHKSDLKWLKEYVRTNCPEKYDEVFRRRENKANYAAYIGMDKHKGFKKCTREDFYAFIKKELKIDDQRVMDEMENGSFMPKQVAISNGVIPYQVNLEELKKILGNANGKFSFLAEKHDGMTVGEKIISLMTFRVPYYVGPLNSASKFAWVVRKPGTERVKVTPWNFDKVIDRDASEASFIRRMTNKCTYLVGQDVLPANSLLYSEFTFLNELNNLKINGEKNQAARKLIYEYAMTHKKVTLKNCLALLVREGMIPSDSTADIFSGIDGDFKTSLAPWYDLRFLGDKLYSHRDMCEQIIVWITLVSDKERMEKLIRRKYSGVLTDDEIKRLKRFNFSGWGRFSEKLLNGIVSPLCADENGEMLTIIRAMRQTGKNFMQLMSAECGFVKVIEEYNAENGEEKGVTYKSIENMRCSPSVKRAIWRTVELVREIVKIEGAAPSKVFVEMARKVNDVSRKGERTTSRKQQLLGLYANIKGEERDWISELQSAPDLQFNSDKLVLYYRQMGRSMYSGKEILLDQVFNTNICDIDHIYPQSKIKDDSLDNRVLVFKTENALKSDNYPLAEDVRAKMKPFWLSLKDKGLISEKKYQRLVRNCPLTQSELADFVNRQLVSTEQSTKAAAHVLKELLPDTEIVYAKAGNANIFKDKYHLTKVREVNDLHHAKDAYINIVVGNVYNTKFNHNAAVYFANHSYESYNLNRLYDFDIPGAWRVNDLEKILSTARKNTCRVIRMTFDGKGALFDVNPVSAGKNDDLVPLKAKGPIADTAKYGGYNKASTAYFMLVRSMDKKGKALLSLEAYPMYLDKQTNGSRDAKLRFCKEKQNLREPEIMLDGIKLNTLFKLNGAYVWLRGKTGKRVIWCNANQLFLEEEYMRIAKNVSNYIRDRKKYNNPALTAGEKVTAENNIALYNKLIEKLSSPVYAGLPVSRQVSFLEDSRQRFVALSKEEQCIVLFEVFHLMQCNSVLSDFSLIGGATHAGAISTNKFISDKDAKIIYQSPTGYYRRVIDLRDYL